MKIIGTVSYQSSYYECYSKRLLVRGWFLSTEGYDEVRVNGERAKTGIERRDVYNGFPTYNMLNSGFLFETLLQNEDYLKADYLPVKVEVMKAGKIIYSRMFDIQILKQVQSDKVERILIENNKKKNVSIVFETNIPLFNLRYKVKDTDASKVPYIGVTAREGIAVLYKKKDECNWMPVDLYARKDDVAVNLTHMLSAGEPFSVLVYTPIESIIEKVSVVIHKNFKFRTVSLPKQFIWLGGGYTYGEGVSAASMKFSNMVQRRFASSGEVYAHPDSAYLMKLYKELKENNIFGPNKELIAVLEVSMHTLEEEESLEKILEILLQNCKCIVVWHAQIEEYTGRRVTFVLGNFPDDRIIHINMDYIFDEMKDQCTISDQYINDAGNALICMNIMEHLQSFLKRTEQIGNR